MDVECRFCKIIFIRTVFVLLYMHICFNFEEKGIMQTSDAFFFISDILNLVLLFSLVYYC